MMGWIIWTQIRHQGEQSPIREVWDPDDPCSTRHRKESRIQMGRVKNPNLRDSTCAYKLVCRKHYSCLNATIGSTRVARRAGM